MIIQNLVSNTDEWLKHRRLHKNASEAPMMMGASKNVTRNELLHMKSTGLDREFSDWFQKNILDNGHEVEASARPIAEKIVGEDLFPVSATDDEGWLAASFDGQTMLEDINWECKQWNKEKAADVEVGKVPECDYWQLVHQQAVNPGSKTLYMVTDGTEENCVHLWFEAPEADIKRLKAGWVQFEEDLANYTPVESAPEAVGTAPDQLPTLRIEAKGMITASNLEEFETHARAVLAKINMDLKTDQDFANAEKTVKWAQDVEKRLESAKDSVLAQTATIDEVFRVIDAIKAETRDKRLALDKAVKSQKEVRKTEIITRAKQALNEYMEKANATLNGVRLPLYSNDFAGVIKGKKKLDAMQSAVDDELANAKIDISAQADEIRANLKQLDEHAADYRFLFSDLQQIVTKPADDFAAIVKSRIADHQEAEQKRLDAEREKIRQEEEAKAKRAAAKAVDEINQQEENDCVAAQGGDARQGKKPAYQMPPLKYAEPQSETLGDSKDADTVTISAKEYEQLVHNSKMYLALAAAGVDNWEGYDIAMEIMQEAA